MIKSDEACRLDRRKRAIVDAAHALFVEQGFERTTLGDIVERAGGSLATVYKLFGNKDGLFDAVIFERASSCEAMITDVVAQGGTPAAMLHQLAEKLHAHFLDPDMVALIRIVCARSISDPGFARLFIQRTVTRTRDSLEALFTFWHEAGVSISGDAKMLAEIFLDLFVSDLHAEVIGHGIAIEHSPRRLRARVDFFISGAGLQATG